MKIYLYRQAGAIGAASHWSRKPLHDQDPYRYEFLGTGTWYRDDNGPVLVAPIYHCGAQMEEIKS